MTPSDLPPLPEGLVINDRYKIVKKLGSGTAGTVYRVVQLGINVDRAMKILDPKGYSAYLGPEAFRSTFSKEIALLSLVTHRNLVKIIDADDFTHRETGGEFLYFVMELVRPPEGADTPLNLWDAFARIKTKKGLVEVLLQLLDGIHYLHNHRFRILHSDIKPANILLEEVETESYELKLTDVGVSKILSEIRPPEENGGQTFLYGTRSYAPDYVQDFLNRRAIDRKTLGSFFPHYDLFCLGATLGECVSTERIVFGARNFQRLVNNPKPEVISVLGNDDYELLKRIVLKLVSEDKAQSYKDADEVREDLEKLKSEYLLPLGVQEMAVGGAFKTITLPMQRVYFSERAYKLIKHPMFQRLQNLTQLSFVHQLYPGARHNRFHHVLMAFEMAKRYLEGLLGDSYFKFLMRRKDYELFLVSALLHDIGHYPLAHALEDLREINSNRPTCKVRTDQEMAEHFLTVKCPSAQVTVAEALEQDWKIAAADVLRIIAKGQPRTETESLIQSMIDGAIDVDKVSYLLLDSQQTGARFGLGIDLDAFLSSLVAIPPDTTEQRTSQLGISEHGIAPAESIIAARYGMFSRVYWHRVNRAIMAMLQYAAHKAFCCDKLDYSFERYIEDTLLCTDFESMKLLAKKLDEAIPHFGASGIIIENPLSGIIDGRRRIHKRLVSFSGHPRDFTGRQIYLSLTAKNSDGIERVRLKLCELLHKKLNRDIKDSDVLLDVPKSSQESDALKPVYVSFFHEKGRYQKLDQVSALVQGVHDNFLNLVKKCRVFISPEIEEVCESRNITSVVIQEIRTFLSKGI